MFQKLLAYLKAAIEFLGVENLDSETVRAFVLAMLNQALEAASKTAIKIDDRMFAALIRLVENDTIWLLIYSALTRLLLQNEDYSHITMTDPMVDLTDDDLRAMFERALTAELSQAA